jgi:hypothetical protein
MWRKLLPSAAEIGLRNPALTGLTQPISIETMLSPPNHRFGSNRLPVASVHPFPNEMADSPGRSHPHDLSVPIASTFQIDGMATTHRPNGSTPKRSGIFKPTDKKATAGKKGTFYFFSRQKGDILLFQTLTWETPWNLRRACPIFFHRQDRPRRAGPSRYQSQPTNETGWTPIA